MFEIIRFLMEKISWWKLTILMPNVESFYFKTKYVESVKPNEIFTAFISKISVSWTLQKF